MKKITKLEGIIALGIVVAIGSQTIIARPNKREIKIVDVMFTTDCRTCGNMAEGDYSIVSEKGQIRCNECSTYEELKRGDSLVEDHFGEDNYAR